MLYTYIFYILHLLIFSKIIIGVLSHSSSALPNNFKWVNVHVPQFKKPGELAHLLCDYDLGDNNLYAVKWYKDDEEFYRFVPKERPQASSYNLEGIHVDLSASDSRRVVLRQVNLRTSGLFRCEVSAEAPSFSSAQSEARMSVVSLPKEDPKISGMLNEYHIGMQIHLNCTSARSYPASALHWYINEQKVTNIRELIHYPQIRHRHGLLTTVLGLHFHLKSRHFLSGTMHVKCVASVGLVLEGNPYHQSFLATRTESLSMIDERETYLLGEWRVLVHVKNIAQRNLVPGTLLCTAIIIAKIISMYYKY